MSWKSYRMKRTTKDSCGVQVSLCSGYLFKFTSLSLLQNYWVKFVDDGLLFSQYSYLKTDDSNCQLIRPMIHLLHQSGIC